MKESAMLAKRIIKHFRNGSIKISPVTSSNIDKVAWEKVEAMGVLYVQFKTRKEGLPGAVWAYYDVDYDIFIKMCASDSVGTFFGNNIKANNKITQLKVQ